MQNPAARALQRSCRANPLLGRARHEHQQAFGQPRSALRGVEPFAAQRFRRQVEPQVCRNVSTVGTGSTQFGNVLPAL